MHTKRPAWLPSTKWFKSLSFHWTRLVHIVQVSDSWPLWPSCFKTIQVSNSLDSDQAQHFDWPDLGPNCLQRLLADNKSQPYGVKTTCWYYTFWLKPWLNIAVFHTSPRIDWLPLSNLIMHTQKYFFHWFLNLMMAEFEVLRAERKDNSDGKTMSGLFLLVRTSLLNQWTYDREPVYSPYYLVNPFQSGFRFK